MRTLASTHPGSLGLAGRSAMRLGRAVGEAFQTIQRVANEMLERSRQRDALARLDDTLLKDIGVMRGQVERELGKWFWQP